jgi:O-Antigen ligase
VVTSLGTLAVAGGLCLIVFYAKGGPDPVNPGPMTTLEMALTLVGGAVVAGVVARAPRTRTGPVRPGTALPGTALPGTLRPGTIRPGPAYGLWPAALLLAFAALSVLSVVWSVQPDESWGQAGQMLAYSAVFAAATALARAAPARWGMLLGGVLLAAVVVCGWALLTKVAPGSLDPNDPYARLRAPYEYWNAIGLTAAMGVVACLWLGARRAGHALLSALSYPAMGLLLVTLMMAYSRGSLVAASIGVALWLCITPLRLRGVAVLLTSGAAAAAVVAWVFSQHALSNEKVALAARVDAGGQLGVVLAAMLVALTVAGVAIGFATNRRAPRPGTRRRMGTILLILPLIALVALLGLLAHSGRGLTGSISHDVSSLADPNARVPLNTPGRLTAIGSVRARYWNEALEVFSEHPLLGAGADGYATARLRHRTVPIDVHHAHGFVVQTMADLGLVGLALALALLATWLAAAGRATHPFNLRWRSWGWRPIAAPFTPERIGLLTMLCVVVTFGAHSLVDWTWYIPGDACVALLCAGWLAGRGLIGKELPLALPAEEESASNSEEKGSAPSLEEEGSASSSAPGANRGAALSPRMGLATAVVLASLLAAWAQWQPLRSVDAANEALALLPRDPAAARAKAQQAVARDPLSWQALSTLATVQENSGESAQARATLQREVRLQPSNPQTWKVLGEYDLAAHDPQDTLNELRAAIYLNPEAIAPEATIVYYPELIELRNAYLLALRETGSG